MALHSFTQVLTRLTPTYLRGKWGRRWITAIGGEFDLYGAWAKEGVKARLILECPDDAVEPIGRERGILRVPGESLPAYRLRVYAAWDTWQWSGTDIGIYKGMETLGWQITSHLATLPPTSWPAGWQTLGNGHVWLADAAAWIASGGCPDGDDDPTHWARFWLALDGHAHGLALDGTWADPGTWDDGGVWDFSDTLTADEVERWRWVVRKWKDSSTTCVGLLVVMSAGGWADIWGPFGDWDDADEGTWDGDVRFIRVGEA